MKVCKVRKKYVGGGGKKHTETGLPRIEMKVFLYKSYRTHGIMKNKIERFCSRFSIFYDSMKSDCDLSHACSPRSQRLVANNFYLCFALKLVGAWDKWLSPSKYLHLENRHFSIFWVPQVNFFPSKKVTVDQASSLQSMRVAYSDHSSTPVCGFRSANPVLHGTNSTEPNLFHHG